MSVIDRASALALGGLILLSQPFSQPLFAEASASDAGKDLAHQLNNAYTAVYEKVAPAVVVVDVEGQLIVGNRQELKQKVLDELEKGERKFLIDFSRTGYIDSSGLGVLVSLSKKIREQGGELRLANLNDDLKTLFELTKLDTLFQIADTRERGLQSF